MGRIYINKRNFYSMLLCILLLFSYFIVAHKDDGLQELCLKSFIFIVLTYVTMFWKSKHVTGGMMYCICLAFMHIGQIILIAFDMTFTKQLKGSVALGVGYSDSNVAVFYTTLACIISVFVVNLFERANNREFVSIDNSGVCKKYNRITPLGWLVIISVGLLAVLSDFTRVISVAAVGYGAGYKQTSALLYYADMVFTICIFLIISVYKDNAKVIYSTVIFVLIRAGVSAFFIGARSDAVLDIIMTIFAIMKLSNSAEIKKRILKCFVLICIAGIIVLPFTGIARNDTALTLTTFFREYSPINYILTEFGGTIVNVRMAISESGALPIVSFFSSFLSIVPMSTAFIPSLKGSYGNAYASYLNVGFGGGLGGSLIGESAFWFGTGFGGLLYIALFAFIIVACMNRLEKNRYSSDVAANTALLFLLYEMFYQIRGSVSSLQSGMKLAIYFFIIIRFAEKYLLTSREDNNFEVKNG